MKPTIYTLALITAGSLISCSESKPPSDKPSEEENHALIIGDPMDCGLDSITVFPVGASLRQESSEEKKEDDDRTDPGDVVLQEELKQLELRASEVAFSANSVESTEYMWDSRALVEYRNDDQNLDIRNLVFYNFHTGESYSLIDDTIHILSFAIHHEFDKPMIFYRVVHKDYNKDQRFNGLDPVSLYISNLDGTQFKQITPSNEHFIDYSYYEATKSLLIKTAIDSNKDLKFLANDETNFRRMDLKEPKFAKSILSDEMKNTLRGLNR